MKKDERKSSISQCRVGISKEYNTQFNNLILLKSIKEILLKGIKEYCGSSRVMKAKEKWYSSQWVEPVRFRFHHSGMVFLMRSTLVPQFHNAYKII